ncbi:MAG TPA: LptF/LptG family permease [Candidatus Acidoferrum sp.]|nr:LptF/LptG family permease [Candidatus Acidoferrum sp.]
MASFALPLRQARRYWGLSILDRYMLSELGGPFIFGLSAFMLIFAATQLLYVGRLVSSEHVPLWAAIEIFIWTLPAYFGLVFPMALLLGTLLAVQRLSGESELTAMKAGGISFMRIVIPLLAAGFVMSFVTYLVQEIVAPYAADQVAQIEDQVIAHASAFNRDLTVSAPLPGGGKQITIATSYDRGTQALLHVTLIQYDRNDVATQIIFADRAEFSADKWVLSNASLYRFNPDGTLISEPQVAQQQVELGEKPTDIVKRLSQDDPENLSRKEIADIVHSGQLTQAEMAKYVTTYQEKLAQPFACFVFVLIAIPYGMRAARSGGGTSVGFGLAVLIVFVYYIVLTVCSYVSQSFVGLAWFWAWLPNIVFTAIGVARLRRVAAQ